VEAGFSGRGFPGKSREDHGSSLSHTGALMLYICPTPIGNLGDITLRVLEVLRRADLIACEDTRRTGVLLCHHGIDTGRLVSFHDQNEDQRIRTLLPLLREGREVALVSDAGMPGLSDPGFSLVRACATEGIAVTVLPGASAISTALVLSAVPADRFAFVGFLARGKQKLLGQLDAFTGTGAALVAFESPRRLRASLEAIAERWPERRLAVCRELSKLHEEVLRGTAAEVVSRMSDPVRGEIVVVLEGQGATDLDRFGVGGQGAAVAGSGSAVERDLEERARKALSELATAGVGTKSAARIVAGLTGLSNRRAYALALGGFERRPEDHLLE
jgi:16S rRNA (cytidine1402-2'-O)-methyltransferase